MRGNGDFLSQGDITIVLDHPYNDGNVDTVTTSLGDHTY